MSRTALGRVGTRYRVPWWRGSPLAVVVSPGVLLGVGHAIRGKVLRVRGATIARLVPVAGMLLGWVRVPCPCCARGTVTFSAARRAIKRGGG